MSHLEHRTMYKNHSDVELHRVKMTEVKQGHNIWILLGAILVPNAGGWVGAALYSDRDWFENLNHPPWRPPNWLFPIVWAIMYTLMGVASYYVWKTGEGVQKLWVPLGVYCVHLLVNWFWTPIFFIWHLILVALIDIVVLWVLVVVTIFLFWRTSRISAYLLVPYIAWVTVAVALNSHYYHLNKDA